MYKVKMNKSMLVSHLHYDFWNYIIGIIIALIVWSSCYYYIDPPADKKLDIYYIESKLGDYKSVYYHALKNKFPDIPRIRIYDFSIPVVPIIGVKIDVDFRKQVDKIIKNNPGDIYIFSYNFFSQFAKKGLLMPLDDYMERFYDNVMLTPQEFSELMVIHPYESRDAIYGIKALNEDTREELIISIGSNAGNKEKALEAMKWLIYNLHKIVYDYE